MGKRSELSVEKRIEAVLSMLRKEEPAAQIARRYGVSEQSLYRWRDDFLQAGKQGLSGKTADVALTKEVSRLQREIESREQVIGEFTVANRVLKNSRARHFERRSTGPDCGAGSRESRGTHEAGAACARRGRINLLPARGYGTTGSPGAQAPGA